MNSNLITKILDFENSQSHNLRPTDVINWVHSLRDFIFPSTRMNCTDSNYSCADKLELKHKELGLYLQRIFMSLNNNNIDQAKLQTMAILNEMEMVYDLLRTDLNAIYQADPAAKSENEVLLCYPGFLAITYYRIGHVFYIQGHKLLARIITEFGHSKTGIDIHPGAKINHSFCIDHGTGIVIGETTIIGNNVKIFQGVTLGALSVTKDQAQKQRHPIIGNKVVIYAGATILGGKTIIGDDSVIGGNTWITQSVEPGDKVYFKPNI